MRLYFVVFAEEERTGGKAVGAGTRLNWLQFGNNGNQMWLVNN